MINWNNCYSPNRYGTSSLGDNRSEYQKDWDRLIYSSAFRRLQNKTQVFPLPEEIFVHNRLTHSLEVSTVGRSLGHLIGNELVKIENDLSNESIHFYSHQLQNVLQAACLAHDIGNPAFGHSGEEAISQYFKKRETTNKEDIAFKALFSEQEWCDLTHFEGNANALRILTMQLNGRQKGGFRLTYTTLASILKYPCESLATNKQNIHQKKYGFFFIDEEVFIDIVNTLHLVKDDTTKYMSYKRHPFVYLVEAADDICYNIIDLEDAHRLGILSYERVRDELIKICSYSNQLSIEYITNKVKELESDSNESLAFLRAISIGTLTQQCADTFIANRTAILQGNYNTSLIEDLDTGLSQVLSNIKTLSIDKIYNAKQVIELEVAGFRIMSSLVKDFVTSALTPKELRDKEQQKILALMPQQFSFQESETPYQKVMHIIDFISGMTDIYALKLYRKLRGIDI